MKKTNKKINLSELLENGQVQFVSLLQALDDDDVKVMLVKKGTKTYPALVSKDGSEVYCLFFDFGVEEYKFLENHTASREQSIKLHNDIVASIMTVGEKTGLIEKPITLPTNSSDNLELLLKLGSINKSKNIN